MKIEEVKPNLNKMVRYRDRDNVYRLTGCILRRNENGFYYQCEVTDTQNGRTVIICKLEDIEVIT